MRSGGKAQGVGGLLSGVCQQEASRRVPGDENTGATKTFLWSCLTSAGDQGRAAYAVTQYDVISMAFRASRDSESMCWSKTMSPLVVSKEVNPESLSETA